MEVLPFDILTQKIVILLNNLFTKEVRMKLITGKELVAEIARRRPDIDPIAWTESKMLAVEELAKIGLIGATVVHEELKKCMIILLDNYMHEGGK